jgi:hypothetical protein
MPLVQPKSEALLCVPFGLVDLPEPFDRVCIQRNVVAYD